MFPPTSDCSPAPLVPTMLRERTMMPRTRPRFLMMRWFGSSNAVGTSLGSSAMSSPPCALYPINRNDVSYRLESDYLRKNILPPRTSRPTDTPPHNRPHTQYGRKSASDITATSDG